VCQENELCVWHITEESACGSANDETEEMQIEDEPELLGKVAHKGDVTDLLVSLSELTCIFNSTVPVMAVFGNYSQHISS